MVKFWWRSGSPSGYKGCFPDSSLLADTESGINRLRCAMLQWWACTSRHHHSNYDVITSPALAGGMHVCTVPVLVVLIATWTWFCWSSSVSFLNLFPKTTFGCRWHGCPSSHPSNRVRALKETKHWPSSVVSRYPFFVHHWTADWRVIIDLYWLIALWFILNDFCDESGTGWSRSFCSKGSKTRHLYLFHWQAVVENVLCGHCCSLY